MPATTPSSFSNLRAWALLLAAAHLPFESDLLAVTVGALTVTSFELLASLAVGAHLADVVRSRRWQLSKPAAALLLLVVWCGVSAVFAPLAQAIAVKATLRWGLLAALFWAASVACKNPAFSARLQQLLAGAAVLTATLGLLEQSVLADVVEPLLSPFRPKASIVAGARRLTSTFPHANLTASFLAMALPVVALVPLPKSRLTSALRWFSFVIVASSLVWTQSRGGLVAAAMGLVVVAVLQRSTRKLWPLGALLLCFGVIAMTDSHVAQRWRLGPNLAPYSAVIEAPDLGLRQRTGAGEITVKLRNRGYATWRKATTDPVRLELLRIDRNGEASVVQQFELPANVGRGEAVTVKAKVKAQTAGNSGDSGDFAWRLHHIGYRHFARTPSLRGEGGGEPIDNQLAEEAANNSRLALWTDAAEVIRGNPLLGVGLNAFPAHRRANLERVDARIHTNNLYLEWASGGGLVALLLFVAFGWLALAGALRRDSSETSEAPELSYDVGLSHVVGFAGVVVFALHGLVDAPIYAYSTAGMFVLMAALAGCRDPQRRGDLLDSGTGDAQ